MLGEYAMESLLPLSIVSLVFGGTLIGFFLTKSPGFGKYTTSLLLLILVAYVAASAFSIGKIEWPSLANLLFAIAGYAGGLVSPKNE
jgi:hypothetical protein